MFYVIKFNSSFLFETFLVKLLQCYLVSFYKKEIIRIIGMDKKKLNL